MSKSNRSTALPRQMRKVLSTLSRMPAHESLDAVRAVSGGFPGRPSRTLAMSLRLRLLKSASDDLGALTGSEAPPPAPAFPSPIIVEAPAPVPPEPEAEKAPAQTGREPTSSKLDENAVNSLFSALLAESEDEESSS